jgi:hypothetical protein
MSSARRIQEDLRRILGYQDTQGGLQPPNERLRIDAGRGVFVIGTGETRSGSGSGATDSEGNPIDPVVPPEGDANQNDDGSGTGDSSTDPALPDEIEVIDPEDSNYDVGDDLFGGNWGSNGKIGFVDCVEDTCIEIVPRGGYVPPEGWLNADNPPPIPPPPFGGHPVNGFRFHTSAAGVDVYGGSVFEIYTALNIEPFDSRYEEVDLGGGDWRFRFIYFTINGTRWSSASLFILREVCTSCTYDPPPEFEEHWPSDDCIQLAPNESGQWAASEFENPNDLTAKYSNPRSVLDLCTPSGDGVQILPGADGGTVFWNYSQGSFMAISPDGKRSFGGSSALKGVVAGAVYGGDGPKAVGDPTPS